MSSFYWIRMPTCHLIFFKINSSLSSVSNSSLVIMNQAETSSSWLCSFLMI